MTKKILRVCGLEVTAVIVWTVSRSMRKTSSFCYGISDGS
jgi:hypothetical protein